MLVYRKLFFLLIFVSNAFSQPSRNVRLTRAQKQEYQRVFKQILEKRGINTDDGIFTIASDNRITFTEHNSSKDYNMIISRIDKDNNSNKSVVYYRILELDSNIKLEYKTSKKVFVPPMDIEIRDGEGDFTSPEFINKEYYLLTLLDQLGFSGNVKITEGKLPLNSVRNEPFKSMQIDGIIAGKPMQKTILYCNESGHNTFVLHFLDIQNKFASYKKDELKDIAKNKAGSMTIIPWVSNEEGRRQLFVKAFSMQEYIEGPSLPKLTVETKTNERQNFTNEEKIKIINEFVKKYQGTVYSGTGKVDDGRPKQGRKREIIVDGVSYSENQLAVWINSWKVYKNISDKEKSLLAPVVRDFLNKAPIVTLDNSQKIEIINEFVKKYASNDSDNRAIPRKKGKREIAVSGITYKEKQLHVWLIGWKTKVALTEEERNRLHPIISSYVINKRSTPNSKKIEIINKFVEKYSISENDDNARPKVGGKRQIEVDGETYSEDRLAKWIQSWKSGKAAINGKDKSLLASVVRNFLDTRRSVFVDNSQKIKVINAFVAKYADEHDDGRPRDSRGRRKEKREICIDGVTYSEAQLSGWIERWKAGKSDITPEEIKMLSPVVQIFMLNEKSLESVGAIITDYKLKIAKNPNAFTGVSKCSVMRSAAIAVLK